MIRQRECIFHHTLYNQTTHSPEITVMLLFSVPKEKNKRKKEIRKISLVQHSSKVL